ncbi:MAG: glycerol dehydrogenase, partial [Deltaproteobacteria bacterium]|nr:glycerol dehydrogenase [Deltaproteobacteria bacterium]
MIWKAVFPGKYIQGEGVLSELPDWIHWFGKKGLIVASRSAQKLLAPHAAALRAGAVAVEPFPG